MLSQHILQALVVADHASRLRAEADEVRLARAAAGSRSRASGSAKPRLGAVRRLVGRAVGADWPAGPTVPSLRDYPYSAPTC